MTFLKIYHRRLLFLENAESKLLKGTVMQIEKTLINDRLCASKVS